MPKNPNKSRLARAAAAVANAVREAVRYDLMLLKVRTYLTESEQLAIAFILAVLTIGIVRKYFM